MRLLIQLLILERLGVKMLHDSLSMQLIGEFVGTAMMILLGDGVCADMGLSKSKARGANWVGIAFGWGMAITFSVYFVKWLTPGYFNPAVAVAMAISGSFSWSYVLPYIIAEVAGAFVGAILVWLMFYPHWQETKDQEAILTSFATAPAIRNYFWNFFAEMLATFVLVYGLLAFSKSGVDPALNPILAGTLITAIAFSLGGPTGIALNPARDFGPRLAHQVLPIANKGNSDWAYSWVPIVGPFVGGILAALLFVGLR